MRKIGSVTPLWNQELFIGPHFEMLSKLDVNIVLMHDRPLPSYKNEHGYSTKKDLSEKILREKFPNVLIFKAMYPPELDFAAGLYNEGLVMAEEMGLDIVFRLDPDMLWTKKNWKETVDLVRSTNNDCYRMNFADDSINYYMTGDFNHGLKDAREYDPLAVDPKKKFFNVIDYPAENTNYIKIPNWICHHFRGWNKPKSTPPDWYKAVDPEYIKEFGDKGKWYKCDPEVKATMEVWLKELGELKNGE